MDDFYLTRSQRQNLAQRIHRLLLVRGVPGTHDVDLALSTINSLIKGEIPHTEDLIKVKTIE
ncbi:MAG: hypothetical protein CM15mP51_15420 [Porticoccaceae bacterium]|nr:MAG: hypothetical protein CM15mP51_15420 [Porticoccaceae bacterium]